MITRLEIANYKSIKSLDLEMQPFMVLVGPNGAGKTNIVQAIELLGAILQAGTTDPARQLGWSQIIHREKKPARSGVTLAATVPLKTPVSVQGAAGRRRVVFRTLSVRISLTLKGRVDGSEIRVEAEEFEITSAEGRARVAIRGGEVEVDAGGDPSLWVYLRPILAPRRRTRAEVERHVRSRLSPEDDSGDGEQEEADSTVLRLLTRRFSPLSQRAFEACLTTKLRLDASALLGREYGKTTDGPKLFAALDFPTARLHGPNHHGSRSLHLFLEALGV